MIVREIYTQWVRVFTKTRHFVGGFVVRLFLFLLFWFIIVPIHFTWLLLGKDPMNREWNSDQVSYFDNSKAIDPNHWHRML